MSEDFDKSEQKKTEYVLVDLNDVNRHNTGAYPSADDKGGKVRMEGRIQDEINKRPNMRLVNIIPFSPRGMDGGHNLLHLLFEEREHNLDSIREDIGEMKKHIEKIAHWADKA